MFSTGDMKEIGERELRKILNQTLTGCGVSLFHQNCFIESLSKIFCIINTFSETFLPGDERNMFRRFIITEVVEALEEIWKFSSTTQDNQAIAKQTGSSLHTDIDDYVFGTEG